jgi:hypothetical protein
MENNDAVRPVGELVRRATHVALMSPLLIFLATPFDDLNRPYGPGIFTVGVIHVKTGIDCLTSD